MKFVEVEKVMESCVTRGSRKQIRGYKSRKKIKIDRKNNDGRIRFDQPT
jgi:hypothetical protein